jgi:hypothetical protein
MFRTYDLKLFNDKFIFNLKLLIKILLLLLLIEKILFELNFILIFF